MRFAPDSNLNRAVLAATILVTGMGITASLSNATRQKVGTTLAIPSPEQQPKVLSLEEERERRAKLADVWLTCAQELANVTNDEEAQRLFQFINDNADLAMPTEKGIRLLTNRNASHRFYFVPLFEGDKQGMDASRNAAAWFQPNPGILAVKSNPKSKFGRGMDMLHEAHHARSSLMGNVDSKDMDAYCAEEREAHVFQHRLYARAGGHVYNMIVGQEVKRLKAAKGGGKISATFADRLPFYDQRLNDAFEQPESESEEDDRQTNVWIDAVFRIISETHKDPAIVAQKQAEFLAEVYGKQGLLPQKK